MIRGFQKTTLKNGLTILGEVMPESKSCALGFFVHTGSRDEVGRESGISHFLEHMVFKGTKKRSALDITFEFGQIGAQSNAYTSEESTVYHGAVLADKREALLDILADMMEPSLDREEFEMERKVILEEIALYQDKPHYVLIENALKDFFGDHSCGNSVLGSIESISTVTRDEMYAYWERRYAPSNMVVAAAGNLDWEQFVGEVENRCGHWKSREGGRTLTAPQFSVTKKVWQRNNLHQQQVLLMAPSCSAQDDARFSLSVLSTILGDSHGSKLYWKLVDTGLAEGASADNDERDGTGLFIGYASCEAEDLEQVSSILHEVLSTPLEFTDEELERAKRKLLSRVILGGELPMGRLMAIGGSYLARKQVLSLDEVQERLSAISRRDIEEAVARFPMNSWSEYRMISE